MNPPDWAAAANELLSATHTTIEFLASNHGQFEYSQLAYDCEPELGVILISWDTSLNSMKRAKEFHDTVIVNRPLTLEREDSWKHASYFLRYPVIAPYCQFSTDFEFYGIRGVMFPEWAAFRGFLNYPEKTAQSDDYLEGHCRILLWRVIEELVKLNAFAPLILSKPFMISHSIRDQGSEILRMINWPS